MIPRRGAPMARICCVVAVVCATAVIAVSADLSSYLSTDNLCNVSQATKDYLATNKTEGKIYMHVFYPGSNMLTDDQDTVKIAAELARNHINSHPSILPDHELELVFSKTQAVPSEGTWKLVQATTDPQYANITWAMFIGASSSEVTMPLAAIANHYYKLVMISFGATSPELTEGDTYPQFYRTIPSEVLSNVLRLAFMQKYNWSKIAILYRAQSIFQKSETDFRNLYERAFDSHEDITTRSFADDPETAINSLLINDEADLRIVFAWVDEMAAKVLSIAYAKGRLGPKYVWILPGWLKDNWWENVTCGGCDIERDVLTQNVFLVDSYGEAQDNDSATPLGTTKRQFDAEFEECLNLSCPGQPKDRRRYYMYDAILAGALALNEIEVELSVNNMSLSDISYENAFITNATTNELDDITFQGVSGNVTFEDRSRDGVLALYQYVMTGDSAEKRLIALYVNGTDTELTYLDGIEPQWAGDRNSPPLDRSRVDIIYLLQPSFAPVVYTFTAITAVAIVMNICLFMFNLFTARMKLFKSSGPLLNAIIIFGCIVVLLGTYIVAWVEPVVTAPNQNVTDTRAFTFGVFCNVRIWLFTIGFSLSFGALFAKIWQAYRVYTTPALKEKTLQYWNFFLVIGIFIVFDVIFLLIWTCPDWRLWHSFYMYPTTDDDVVYRQDFCDGDQRIFFEGALLVIKALLIIFGFFLAYESRNVQYEHLTDTRYTSYAMFIVVGVLFFFGVPMGVLYFVGILDAFIYLYVFVNLVVILSTSGCLLALFIPRFIALAQGKQTLLPPQQNGDEVDVGVDTEMGKVDETMMTEDARHTSIGSSYAAEMGSFGGTAELGSFGTSELGVMETTIAEEKSTEVENGSSASSDSGTATLDNDSRRPSIQNTPSEIANGSAVLK